MRSVTVLGISVCLLAFAVPVGSPAAAAPRTASAAAVAPTQDVTGAGSGRFIELPSTGIEHTGTYSSTGQLGHGQFSFQTAGGGGPARFSRSDGMTLSGTSHEVPDACGVITNSSCLMVDLHGVSDIASARLTLAVQIAPAPARTSSFLMAGGLTLRRRVGYVMLGADGTTHAFGGFDHLGDTPATGFRATDLDMTPTGNGYWITDELGKVSAFGDAPLLGDAHLATLARGEVVTSMSATPSGKGYWLFTTNGRAIPFGDASFFGDMHAIPLNGGIVGSAATPTGRGYYMVGGDGGVFAFGDARFRGSMGGTRLNRPVVGLVPTPDNTGYWLVASDGGVFSFDAKFSGSLGSIVLNRPVVGMMAYGDAYLMVASDGGVFDFAHAPFFGSAADEHLSTDIVNVAAAAPSAG